MPCIDWALLKREGMFDPRQEIPLPCTPQNWIQIEIQILLWVRTHAGSCGPFLSACWSLLGEGSKSFNCIHSSLGLPVAYPSEFLCLGVGELRQGFSVAFPLSSFNKAILPPGLGSAVPGSTCYSTHNPFLPFSLWRPKATLPPTAQSPLPAPAVLSLYALSPCQGGHMCP